MDKELLTERGKTAHDICSVAALNWAFEDCRDGDAYDLGECCSINFVVFPADIPARGCMAASRFVDMAHRSARTNIETMCIHRRK